ncbi:hypothetical protein PPERSA_02329 [Pseudocohnilembus persalinus]|uniref:eRF1 domain-containing protein n=1 Tax=Pseudocohnilembus persalinus TaxID=266149 RepID=A0A0V0QV91_PSEPJ|nr:hypothetical protein PPERSA_02329 [Pseudocohnilembus persalinus]|eukprot:KRX05797.1 hypothetical protein PPERSA_02329 [Pseudocohnilembus persalinus]
MEKQVGYIIINQEGFLIAVQQNNDVKILQKEDKLFPKKRQNKGGASAQRFERIRIMKTKKAIEHSVKQTDQSGEYKLLYSSSFMEFLKENFKFLKINIYPIESSSKYYQQFLQQLEGIVAYVQQEFNLQKNDEITQSYAIDCDEKDDFQQQ